MKIISFITEVNIIKKILKYLELSDEESSRDPPVIPDIPNEIVYAPIDDGWSQPGSDFLKLNCRSCGAGQLMILPKKSNHFQLWIVKSPGRQWHSFYQHIFQRN